MNQAATRTQARSISRLLGLACALCLSALAPQATRAAEPDGTAALERIARDWIDPTLASTLPNDQPQPLRPEVEIGKLDPRLRLAACNRVEPHLPRGMQLWGRSRIGLRCAEGVTHWNVFLPVTVKVWGPAWVLKRTVTAGSILTQEDAELQETDWAEQRATVLAVPDLWVGQKAAYTLLAGQALRGNMVRPSQAFAVGSQVRVSGSGTGFEVVVTGQALTAGLLGQSARIRLPGGKVVTGLVRDAQTVDIAL